MIAPRYIREGLQSINSMYFAVFNPCIMERKSMSAGRGRWQIRKWTGVFPKRFDLWNCYGYSDVIFTICKEDMTEMGLVDAGYEEIDMKSVEAIRESNYWKADYKKKIADLDWSNEKLERQANAELDYESKYVAKRIWRSLHEPTVHLSGKDWVR